MFHGIQVAIMLALMTNIIQFAYWKQRGKSQKPIYLLCLLMKGRVGGSRV